MLANGKRVCIWVQDLGLNCFPVTNCYKKLDCPLSAHSLLSADSFCFVLWTGLLSLSLSGLQTINFDFQLPTSNLHTFHNPWHTGTVCTLAQPGCPLYKNQCMEFSSHALHLSTVSSSVDRWSRVRVMQRFMRLDVWPRYWRKVTPFSAGTIPGLANPPVSHTQIR